MRMSNIANKTLLCLLAASMLAPVGGAFAADDYVSTTGNDSTSGASASPWRTLQKAAVRAGGAVNHRGNLSDWVMFKDNHLAVLGIAEAVTSAKAMWPGRLVHVEATDLEQLTQALEAGADAVLLDNMTPEEAKAAVDLVDDWVASKGGGRPLLECSGGITVETAGAYSAAGVDLISTSQITQSAPPSTSASTSADVLVRPLPARGS